MKRGRRVSSLKRKSVIFDKMKEGNENEKGKKRRDVEALLLLSLRRRGMCEEAELNARRVRER